MSHQPVGHCHSQSCTDRTTDQRSPTRTGPCRVPSRRPCPDRSEPAGSSHQRPCCVGADAESPATGPNPAGRPGGPTPHAAAGHRARLQTGLLGDQLIRRRRIRPLGEGHSLTDAPTAPPRHPRRAGADGCHPSQITAPTPTAGRATAVAMTDQPTDRTTSSEASQQRVGLCGGSDAATKLEPRRLVDLGAATVNQLAQDLQDPAMPPEINRLGRTIWNWRAQIADWHAARVTNAATEAAILWSASNAPPSDSPTSTTTGSEPCYTPANPTGRSSTPSLPPETRRAGFVRPRRGV